MAIRVGMDLVCSAAVQESIQRHGDRYLHRVYTDWELEECGTDPLRLAARFAAKEATLKALRGNDEPIAWRTIGVRRGAGGRPTLALSGAAAELAASRGVRGLDLSLTHEPPYAAAVVVAEVDK
jgi:holo-[acyl-carrier protein] synthase